MTDMPIEIVEIVEKDLQKFDSIANDSQIMGAQVDKVIRNSKNAWIPTSHWIGGWLWYYIDKVNRENFCYDITEIDGGSIQYTQYGEGQFYNWHQDADIDTFHKPQLVPSSGTNLREDQTILQGEYVRKLSFALQLSDPNDYTGGGGGSNGNGGLGGGGNSKTNALFATGGGGGGGNGAPSPTNLGGSGGSGIVIIAYPS